MNMSKFFYDCSYTSLNHVGETLCGDKVEIVKTDKACTMVLADGLGSGVKANILATLTSKILGTMLSEGVSIDECVDTIIYTLPVCKVRNIAYSTFSIVQIIGNKAILIQYDNPRTKVFRNGENFDYPYTSRLITNKKVFESVIELEPGDAIFMYSDGVIHAGVGKFFNFGWEMEEVVRHTEIFYKDYYTAKSLSMLVADACNDLYDNKPGDDTTVAVVKVRLSAETSLIIGPPVDKSQDYEFVKKFLSYPGYKIVSGGTTCQVVSKYLNSKIETNLNYYCKEIPPTAKMKGIDLVTEGSLTLFRVVEILKRINEKDCLDYTFADSKDGASLLVRFLLEKASTIHLVIGRALNPAHQKYDFPINFNEKLELVTSLKNELIKFGRTVTIEYY